MPERCQPLAALRSFFAAFAERSCQAVAVQDSGPASCYAPSCRPANQSRRLPVVLTRFRVHNFRGFQDLEVGDLGKLNILVGPNGSGKTSLLQAIFLLFLEGRSGQLLQLVRPEEHGVDCDGMRQGFEWLQHRGGATLDSQAIRVQGIWAGGQQSAELGFMRQSVDELPWRAKFRAAGGDAWSGHGIPATASQVKEDHEGADFGGDDFEQCAATARFLVTLRTVHGSGAARITRLALGARGILVQESEDPAAVPVWLHQYFLAAASRIAADLPRLLSVAEESGRLPGVVRFLQEFDPGIQSLSVAIGSNNTPVARMHHRRLGVAPVHLLGDGLVAAAHFLMQVESRDFRVALLDGFDAPFHVGLLQTLVPRVLSIARHQGAQFFVSTHRSDTLEALARLAPEDLCDVRVIQLSNGSLLQHGQPEGRESTGLRARVIAGDSIQRLVAELGIDLRLPT